MNGFIIYPTYRIINDKSKVYLFGRLDNGESFLTINDYNPYFFIKKSDVKKGSSLVKFQEESVSMKDFDSIDVTKIIFDTPKDLQSAKSTLEQDNIVCYESDIRYVMKFLMDNMILGSMSIDGEYTKGNFVDRIYDNPNLNPSEWIPKLKVCSIDIETDPTADKVFCISLVCDDYKKVIIHSDKELKNAISVESEKQVLIKFSEIIKELDPDIIIGWNVIDFDLRVLKDKFSMYKIPFELGRTDWPCQLRIESSYFRDSSADFPGRVILDGIHLMKSSFIKLDDYKLGTAAKEFVGDKKLIGDESKVEDIQNAFKNNPQLLVDYNLHDSQLVIDIMKRTGLIDLTIQRSLLTGLPLDKVKASIASFDSLYLRNLRKKGFVAYSSRGDNDGERIKGGFVQESKPGIYDFILVLDFKSLYPSIIRTFNIDPLSFVENCEGENLIKAPNGACFRNEEGILPQIISEMWAQRDKAKKENNPLSSQAIKILMNSFFGVLANPTCRFFSLKIANAITHFGQHLLKMTSKKVSELGYEVIYGDTDSIFVKSGTNNLGEAQKNGVKIQKYINEFFLDHVTKEYNRENFLELEFEKTFNVFFMPSVRGSDVGSKKRYAGIVMKNGKEELNFTGLEFVRRDWTDLAKNFQLELFDRVFHKKEVTPFVKKYVSDLKLGKLDKDLVYKKALRKDEGEYTKMTPPHVKAARLLDKIDSSIISYVMTKNGPQPIQKITSSIDYEHYIEKQIKPLADSILVFYNEKFDEIISGVKQKTLFSF